MSTGPTRISGPKPAAQIDQDWNTALKDPKRSIPLALTDELKRKDPQAHALLSQLSPAQLDALKQADKNGSGTLTLPEVQAFLVKNGKLKEGGKFDDFTAALNALFTGAAGKAIDVRTPNASVLYLQVNNNTEKGSYLYNAERQNAERNALSRVVGKDPDQPELAGLDITKEFNKGPAEASAAFRSGMQSYLDGLLATGGSMTGLVLSGHSNGTKMLFEHPHHAGYTGHLDIRAELQRFRDMEKPPGSGTYPYRALFDGTEKVGLLACYQGGNIHEWRKIFPNAVIAGTENFSPDAGSAASPAIYSAAAAARQYYEDGGDFTKAEAVGRGVPNARTDGLQGHRGLKISVPGTDRLAAAAADFEKARKDYAAAAADIDKALREGKGAVSAARMRDIYSIARTYVNAASALKDAGGTPIGADGKTVDLARATKVTEELFRLRF